MQETTKTNPPSWLWLAGWVIANFIGVMIGAALGFALAYITSGGFGAPVEDPEPVSTVTIIFIGLLFVIPAGVILGAFQSIAIMNYLDKQNRWFPFTAAGYGLAVLLLIAVSSITYLDLNLGFWVILSSSIGIFQWTIIRKTVYGYRSYYWILANIIQGSIAGILGRNWIIGGAFYWGIGSIITGVTLIWLLSTNQHSFENK